MKRYTVAHVRERLADVLDEAEQGNPVVIERRGVRYVLAVESTPQRRSKRSAIETLVGGSVGFLAGGAIGFAIANRVDISKPASEPGFIALGAVISAVIGATAGSLIAYFGSAGVGNLRDGTVEFTDGGAASEPASSQAASQPAN